jgi:hypothetical protein
MGEKKSEIPQIEETTTLPWWKGFLQKLRQSKIPQIEETTTASDDPHFSKTTSEFWIANNKLRASKLRIPLSEFPHLEEMTTASDDAFVTKTSDGKVIVRYIMCCGYIFPIESHEIQTSESLLADAAQLTAKLGKEAGSISSVREQVN